VQGRVVEHPLMAVALRLMAEFPGHALTVLRILSDCADDLPNDDPAVIEETARVRLIVWLREHDGGALSS
jgi:hypothetical protein